MRGSSIALIGMPGSGKSTIGRLLAKHLNWKLFDVDLIIEQRANKSVSQIFAEQGEEKFRMLEASTIEELVGLHHAVISTGGGAPTYQQSAALLKGHCHCVYLKANVETLYSRLKKDRKRPLLQVDDPFSTINGLFDKRDPIYQSIADTTVDSGLLSATALTNQIVRELQLS